MESCTSLDRPNCAFAGPVGRAKQNKTTVVANRMCHSPVISAHLQVEHSVRDVVAALYYPTVARIDGAYDVVFDRGADQIVVRLDDRADQGPNVAEHLGPLVDLADAARCVTTACALRVDTIHEPQDTIEVVLVHDDLARRVVILECQNAQRLPRVRRLVAVE